MISTFGSFSMAKLGIRSSQHGLHITGNNISNINTNGYTRQRINQVSLYYGTADRYASALDVRMGVGSLVTSVSQIRDPFLDIRYRNEACGLGFFDEKMANLEELKRIMDEVSKDGIHTGIEEIRTQLQNLAKNPNSQVDDGLVQSACQKLVSLLNKYAADLKAQKESSLQGFDQNVDEVNKILTNIQNLNKEIRDCQLHGDPALELLDNRNMLIDQLSQMTKIKVSYYPEKLSSGIVLDNLKIELDAPGQDPTNRPVLIDGLFANQLEISPLDANKKPDISADEYDIKLKGLADLNGDSPIVAAMKKEMNDLNSHLKSLDRLNQRFKDLDAQRQQWNTDIATGGWGADIFTDAGKRDAEIKKLEGTVADAQKKVREAKNDQEKEAARKELKEAQDKLSTFRKLDNQNTELNNQQADLEKQRDSKLESLQKIMQGQGLTLNQTQNADGSVTLTVSGGTPPLTNSPLIDGTKPGQAIPEFDVKVNDQTGDISLELNGTGFKSISSAGDINKKLGALNDKIDALNDLNKEFGYLAEKEKAWNEAIKHNNWNEALFTDKTQNDTTLKQLQADEEKALKDLEAAKPEDKSKLQLAYNAAKAKRESFENLTKEHKYLTDKKATLTAQRDSAFTDFQNALKAQGLNATMTPTPTGPFSISISGGGLQNAIDVVKSDDPNFTPPKFGTTVDANGDLKLNLGTNEFKSIPKGQFDNSAHQLDSLKDGKLYGVLEADLQYLNGKGEFDTPPTEIRGIAYYQRSLDSFAQSFAKTMNQLNRPNPNDPNSKADLFESKDPNNANITASNISISDKWLSGKVHITTSTDPLAGSGDNSNVHNMIAALNNNQKFQVVDKNGNVLQENGKDREFFSGSFEGMFTNMNSVLGTDMMSTGKMLDNAAITTNERAVARDNISTVDLNEEGINLVQYQKSFTAACRVMTTLDEMMESLLSVKR